ncbi:MAG: hypothetical protein ABEJ76_00990 [Halanaeroarchaeum sp.]
MSDKDHRIGSERATSDPARGTDRDGGFSRRRLMAAGAAGWATVSLAGCTDTGGSSGTDETTTEQTTDVTVTNQTTTTTTTTDGGGGGETTTTTTSDGGGSGDGGGDKKCGLSSVFASGMDVGFLVSVYDTFSGDRLDGADLSTVEIRFPDAPFEPIELSPSGPHQEHVADQWGGKLATSADADPGTYGYEIAVGRAGEDEPTPVATDEFTLVEGR